MTLASNATTGNFALGQTYDLATVCRELEITNAQRADMAKLMSSHHRWNSSLLKARQVYFEDRSLVSAGHRKRSRWPLSCSNSGSRAVWSGRWKPC